MQKPVAAFVTLIALVAFFAIDARAQKREEKPPQPAVVPQNEPVVAPCPTITMEAPQVPIRDGKQVGFAVNISGGDSKVVPVYLWSISAGTFLGGQDTRSIAVDSTGAGADKAITATVQLGGFASECTAEATATVSIAGPAKKLDEYSSLPETDENARLDAFISNVTEKEQAFIFVYAGRTSPRGKASDDLKRIRGHLLTAGTPRERLVTIDGGYREEISHELWLVPIGAEEPRRSPTLSAKDIVFPKTTPPVKKP